MTYTEVLELIRAGYTKAEIESMMNSEPNPDPEKKQEPDNKEDPKQEPENKEDPKQEPESETSKLIRALGLQLDTLTKAVQKTNVNTIEAHDNMNDPEQIIARIINPHYGEVK